MCSRGVVLRQAVERAEDAVGAGIDSDGGDVAPLHDAVAVDHIESSLAGPVGRPVDAVRTSYLTLGLEVREQGKMEVAVLCEGDPSYAGDARVFCFAPPPIAY